MNLSQSTRLLARPSGPAINFHYLSDPGAVAASPQLCPASAVQQIALQRLVDDVKVFLHQNHGSFKTTDWPSELLPEKYPMVEEKAPSVRFVESIGRRPCLLTAHVVQ